MRRPISVHLVGLLTYTSTKTWGSRSAGCGKCGQKLSIITGALGAIKKGLVQKLQLLPGHPSAAELQKITLMSTAYIFRKVLG